MQIKENPLGLAFLVENWRALLEPLVLELHHLKSFCQTLNLSLCHLILSTLLTLNFFLLKTRVNMISLSLSFLIGIRILVYAYSLVGPFIGSLYSRPLYRRGSNGSRRSRAIN